MGEDLMCFESTEEGAGVRQGAPKHGIVALSEK